MSNIYFTQNISNSIWFRAEPAILFSSGYQNIRTDLQTQSFFLFSRVCFLILFVFILLKPDKTTATERENIILDRQQFFSLWK